MLYGRKLNSLTNCRVECAHLTITVSQIERNIGRKSSFFHTPFAFDAPVTGVSVGLAPFRLALKKTRMAWLPDGEKISKIYLFVLAQLTNVTRQTDGQTPRAGNSRAYA